MNTVEKVKEICKKRKIPISRLEQDCKFSNAYVSQLKKGVFPDDRLQIISDYLNLSVDYLIGKEDYVACPICGFHDDPLSDGINKEHEEFHQKFLSIKEKYPFFMGYTEAEKQRTDSIYAFRSYQKSIEEKVKAFDKYLESSFSLEILRNNFELTGLDYDQFCRVEVSTLYSDDCISQEFIDTLIEKYGINRDFLAGNEQLLARISNNEQIIRILKYLEKLNPQLLNIAESQIKALLESKEQE